MMYNHNDYEVNEVITFSHKHASITNAGRYRRGLSFF